MVSLLIIIVWGLLRWNTVKNIWKDKNFQSEVWITGLVVGLFLFFFSYAVTVIFLDQLFSPQIKLDYSCKYQSYHGEFVFDIKNTGEVGEEGFTLVVNDIILKNFTVNPIGNQKVIYMQYRENVSGYTIDENWAKDYCDVILSHVPLATDPRPDNKFPKTGGEYLKIECSYFPPNSHFNLHLNSLGDNRNINYEYWGKNTEPKKEIRDCDEAACYGKVKDFMLNLLLKLKGKWEIRQCKLGDYTRSFG